MSTYDPDVERDEGPDVDVDDDETAQPEVPEVPTAPEPAGN